MRLSVAALVPLAILLASPLVANRFSSALPAANNPSTSASVNKQTLSSSSSPACTDLTKVQGPVVVFGFEGKTTPYSVEIDAKGEVTAKGVRRLQELPPVPYSFGFERDKISPSTVRAIVRLASANDFWKLPNVIGRKSSSDTAPMFMTVNLSCASRRVVVYGDSKASPDVQRFAEVYTLLSDLVYDELAYRPLQ